MSSTFNDVRAAIEGRLATEMANSPAVQVAFTNVPFTPPDAGNWIRAQLQFNDNQYFTLRGPTAGFNRQSGILVVDIFTPIGVGAGANYTIAERVKDLFDRVTVSNVTFDAASGPFVVQPAAPEAYFQTQLSMTFDAYLQ